MHKRHKAALWYARRDWRILPVWPMRDGWCSCGHDCESPGKHPIEWLTGNWRKTATTDPDRIRYWWSKVPDANLATCSWLRIDVDTKERGKENWRDLIFDYGNVDTVHCMTPSGGDHYYFRPPEKKLGNGTGDLPGGIDVRGHGSGYTLLPPSNHVQGVYEWELSSRPDEVEIAAAPTWLVEMLPEAGDLSHEVDFDAMLPQPGLARWGLSSLVEAAILGDRSRIDQAIITALVFEGATDDEIRAVFQHYDTTGKYAERGRDRDRYLAHSIAKARRYVAGQGEPEQPVPRTGYDAVNKAYRAKRGKVNGA